MNFEGGKTLFRRYDDEVKLWLTYEAPNNIPPRLGKLPTIEDELLVAKLKGLKSANYEIELDTLYLNSIIKDEEFEKPYLAMLLIIADCRSGMIINQNMLSPKDDVIGEILGMFMNCLMNMGKPKIVYVRDEYIRDYLKDLCERIGVPLKVKGKLKAIDSFERSFSGFGF